jgi:hypothetical protein
VAFEMLGPPRNAKLLFEAHLLRLAFGTMSAVRAATPEQVRETIAELLDEAASDAGVREAMRGERVMMLDTMKLLAERKMDAAALTGAGPGKGGFNLPVPRGIIFSDAAIVVAHETQVVAAFERSPDYAAYRQNAPGVPAALQKSPTLHFVAGMLMPSLDRFILQQYRSKADRRLAATALALRLYAVDHGGTSPLALDELVPNYLPSVPRDPFAAGDKPLRYSRSDPAAPLVYSVGDDGVDDGGSRTSTRAGRNDAGRWDRRDAVLEMKPMRLLRTAEEEKKAAEEEEGS